MRNFIKSLFGKANKSLKGRMLSENLYMVGYIINGVAYEQPMNATNKMQAAARLKLSEPRAESLMVREL